MTSAPNGRPVAGRTAYKQIRQVLNRHAGTLAEKALAGALKGDSTALLAASNLLLAANTQPPK
jgi:hypothetical protein